MVTILWAETSGFINKEYFNDYGASLRRFHFLNGMPDIKWCEIEESTQQNIVCMKVKTA